MNTRQGVAVAALTFVAGVVVGLGVLRTTLTSAITRAIQTRTVEAPTPVGSSSVRGLLGIFVGNGRSFSLTGIDDPQGRCNSVVTATGLHGDYMALKTAQGSEFFVPYSAIYRIDREGPGPITIPVVYTTAHPTPKFCGD